MNSQGTLGYYQKRPTFVSLEYQKEMKNIVQKKYLKTIMAKNFPNLEKHRSL